MKFSRISEEEIIGEKYGKLTVLRYSDKIGKNGKSYVWCQCECGNIKEVCLSNLRHGSVKSCGCLRKEQLLKHGYSKTRLYNVYNTMKQRCTCETCKEYKHYGGRGIKMCSEWLGEHGFENFRIWALNNGFDEKLSRNEQSIERNDVNGDYCPKNCRFATVLEQARNKRNTVRYKIHGEKLTLAEISEKYGVDLGTLAARVYALGYNVEDAVSVKRMTTHKNVKKYTYDGKTLTLTEWSKELGVPRETLVYRLKSGRTYDKVFTTQKDIHILKNKKAED